MKAFKMEIVFVTMSSFEREMEDASSWLVLVLVLVLAFATPSAPSAPDIVSIPSRSPASDSFLLSLIHKS